VTSVLIFCGNRNLPERHVVLFTIQTSILIFSTYRVIIHVINGDSEDPVGDFIAINQELSLYNPRLLNKTQVIVINKIDLPHVRDALPLLTQRLVDVAGHNRVLPISAATKERTLELMYRVSKLMTALPKQSSFDLFLEDGSDDVSSDRVNFEEEDEIGRGGGRGDFELLTDPAYPGQFRIVGKKIEKVVEMTNWEYYEALQRFQRILDAEGISDALQEAGAKQGDLVMIGDWDFSYWDPKNRWIADMGLEEINPRRRPKAYDEDEVI
jgi:GTP-binding protein